MLARLTKLNLYLDLIKCQKSNTMMFVWGRGPTNLDRFIHTVEFSKVSLVTKIMKFILRDEYRFIKERERLLKDNSNTWWFMQEFL